MAVRRFLSALAAGALVALAVAIAASQMAVQPSNVQLRYEEAPAIVWDALLSIGYVGDPADGCKCLDVPEGPILATVDGVYSIEVDGEVIFTPNLFVTQV